MYKVVVVEDEELLRMGLTNFFDWKTFDFELAGDAGNGLKGLELIRKIKPDLVITDIKMPHMSGIEMTEILTKEMPELQFLIISGYDDFEYAKRALKAGVSEYILKPIKMEDLREAVALIREKLNKHYENKKELEFLKQSHAQSKKVKRKLLYSELLIKDFGVDNINNSYRDYNFQNMIFQTGIISLQNFAVLYMDCDYSTIIEKDKYLEAGINRCLSSVLDNNELEKIDVIRTNNGERIICIADENLENLKIIQGKIEHGILNEKTELEPMEIVFGSPETGFEGLKKSYKLARQINENKFIHNWQEASNVFSDTPELNIVNYDLTEIFYEIKNGDVQGLKKAFDDFRNSIYKQNIPYLQTVLAVINVYSNIIKIPDEIGGNISDAIGDPKICYQKIAGKMKRSEMLNELELFCLKLQEYCKNSYLSRKHEIIRKIESFIREHYQQETLSMNNVAKNIYISVSYLGMIIKKETGKTFTEYLTDVRIEQAKKLLLNTDMKNYEIAEAVGYSTPAYFSTVFKASTGMTPSDFKNCKNL